MKYIVRQFGDIDGVDEFGSLNDALKFIDRITAYSVSESEWEDAKNTNFCDPEDNRIIIEEVLDTGHKKVVWHFSGWHWDEEEFGLPQGKLLGHDKSLYEESNT
jgi:hypothetical protein